MSAYETRVQDDCDVSKTADVFEGPFPEYDCYGNLTGEHYKRCRSCGREVLEDTPRKCRGSQRRLPVRMSECPQADSLRNGPHGPSEATLSTCVCTVPTSALEE